MVHVELRTSNHRAQNRVCILEPGRVCWKNNRNKRVSVCHSDLGDAFEAASGYYREPWQWQRIRENQQWVGIFHSTDDPLIPIAEARHVAAQLKGSYFEFANRGHFNQSHEFPEALDFIRRKLLTAS